MTKPKANKQSSTTYLAPYNPFFIALNGITTLFSVALSVGIVLLLINAALNMASFNIRSDNQNVGTQMGDFLNQLASLSSAQIVTAAIVTTIIAIFTIVVGAMIHGIQSYTAMRIAKNKTVTIGEAFSAVLSQFGNYILLFLLINVKVFLWSLLLIIPGIIAFYRYAFSGIVFFDKGLRLNAAIKESNRLTKGGLMTLFASHTLFNIITFGYIDQIIWLASTSQLYREYTTLDKANRSKPGIHWLSWVTLALPLVLFLLAILLFITFAIVIGLSGAALNP